MILVSAHNVHKRYGPQVVLDGAVLTVRSGEKVGLIGPNGCGKTTLLHVVTGAVDPDEGNVSVQRGVRVGYLAQDPRLDGGMTVAESARQALDGVLDLERRAHAVLDELDRTDDEAEHRRLLHRHEELTERFRRAGGYEIEARVERILAGMEFSERLRRARVDTLSGGERSRLALARLLLEAPDVLLLDEPTNHLDIEATEWLEDFLNASDCAAVIVSHDRYLLDRTVGRIVAMRGGRTSEYKGAYTDYELQYEREVETQRRAFRKQQAHIAHELDYIRRYHAGQRSREARGRARKLERLERIDRPLADPKAPILNFRPERRGGEVVCEFRDAAKAFGPRTLFDRFSLAVTRGDRIAVLGPNGSGKTTMLRMLLGEERPTAGRVRIGHNIDVGYADQEHGGLDERRSVLEEVWQVRPSLTEGQMRSFLGRFLFSGEAVYDLVATLSGGERGRVALAKVMLAGPNLLLLDEPTNHLDILAREALEEALLEYTGTVIVVSHDRYFINRIARTILYVGHGRARVYLGDYDYFREKRRAELAAAEPDPAEPKPKPSRSREKRDRKRNPIHATSMDDLERAIMEKEEQTRGLAEQLGDVSTYRDPDTARRVQGEYDRLVEELDGLNAAWEARVDELDGS